MNAYTVSHLAHDAGVSVNVVRDDVLRGLLHPAQHTHSEYCLYDAQALARLRFVRAAFEAGIGLDELGRRLCRAPDADSGVDGECLARLRRLVTARRAPW